MTVEQQLKSIPELWGIYHNWLHQNWEEGYQALNPPITDDELAELENTLGLKIPDDFKQSLQIHNGVSDQLSLMKGQELLCSAEIISNWKCWDGLTKEGIFDDNETNANGGINPNIWWNLKWIPITHDGSGNHFCLDLDPSSDGNVGQVITMWHDDDERELIALSFQVFFNEFVDGVVSGKYVLSDDLGGIFDKDDL